MSMGKPTRSASAQRLRERGERERGRGGERREGGGREGFEKKRRDCFGEKKRTRERGLSLALSHKKEKKKSQKPLLPLVALVLPVVARHHRHPRGAHQLLRLRLVPHRPHRRGRGPHPREAASEDSLGKGGRLGEEAVARVHRRRARRFRGREDSADVEVRKRRRGRAQAHGLVGEGDVRGAGVGVGEDGDGRDACLKLEEGRRSWLRLRGKGNETAASALFSRDIGFPREREPIFLHSLRLSLSLSLSVFSPSLRAVWMIRQAISPRLEISSFGIATGSSRGAKGKGRLSEEVDEEVEEDDDADRAEKPSLLLLHRRRACLVAPRSERRASIFLASTEIQRGKRTEGKRGRRRGRRERSPFLSFSSFDDEF